MFYSVAADFLVIMHLLFIIFVVAGGFTIVRWRWMVLLHVPAAIWGAFVEIKGLLCPLTPWENSLRQLAGEKGYPESFIEHYIIPLIYPAELSQHMLIIMGVMVIAINLCVYTFILYRITRK